MDSANKVKSFLFLIADVAALYASLFITLAIRYNDDFFAQFKSAHAVPFTIIFILWIIVFYIAGLYDLRRLRNNLDFLKTLFLSLGVNAALAVLLFYLIPAFGIAPKTILFIFIVVFAILEIIWRRFVNRILESGDAPNKVLLVGNGAATKEVVHVIGSNPQLGYTIEEWIEQDGAMMIEKIREHADRGEINMIVVSRYLRQDKETAALLYKLLSSGIEIHDFTNFYELILGKVPLSELEETWFLENLYLQNSFSTFFKRAADFIFTIILTAIAIPLVPLIAAAVGLTSHGPIILTQDRVGKNGKVYKHYKFRTMHQSEKNAWLDEDAKRITTVGKFLRRTHLDELPQIINVLHGDLSIVGPRPDFIDFYNELKDKIPYYTIRTITKPGLTGWAQVNFPATTSIEESKERLSYDLYYLKNRSAVLDLLIVLKTIRTVVGALGR